MPCCSIKHWTYDYVKQRACGFLIFFGHVSSIHLQRRDGRVGKVLKHGCFTSSPLVVFKLLITIYDYNIILKEVLIMQLILTSKLLLLLLLLLLHKLIYVTYSPKTSRAQFNFNSKLIIHFPLIDECWYPDDGKIMSL